MNDILLYFRKKLMQQPYSNFLTNEQLTKLLNEQFKSGQLQKIFVSDPLDVLEGKIRILKKITFYKEESSYIESMLKSYRSTKLFNLEELVAISSKIEQLTIYINDLYVKETNKKNIYNKIDPMIEQIDVVLNDSISGHIRSQYQIIKRKLEKIRDSKTFKLSELESVINEVNKLLDSYNYDKKIKENYDNKYKRKYKQKFTRISIAITIVAFIFSSYKVSSWVVDNNNIKKEMKQIDNVVNIEYSKEDNEYKDYIFDIDFSELSTINDETIGYIKVKGTNIDYPFVQTKNNDFYLSHSFTKQYNDAGWIFMDFRNNIDSLSKNNIIYAHGRLDGTMFGSLRNILDKNWYENKENHIITIASKNKTTLWQVFSVYKIKTENYYITTEFNDNIEYIDFIRNIKQRSIYNFNNDLTLNDKVLTLSTCYDDFERVVLHAKLIKEIMK